MAEHPLKIGAALLASGFSRRLGENKLFVEIGGETLLKRALGALPAGVDALVVTRYEQVEKTAKEHGAACVMNPNAAEGIASSIRLAAKYFAEYDGLLLAVCDQPLLQRASLERLLSRFLLFPDCVVCAALNGCPRNPAIFPRAYFAGLAALRGNQSGKTVIALAKNVEMTEFPESELEDADTWEDIMKIRNMME